MYIQYTVNTLVDLQYFILSFISCVEEIADDHMIQFLVCCHKSIYEVVNREIQNRFSKHNIVVTCDPIEGAIPIDCNLLFTYGTFKPYIFGKEVDVIIVNRDSCDAFTQMLDYMEEKKELPYKIIRFERDCNDKIVLALMHASLKAIVDLNEKIDTHL